MDDATPRRDFQLPAAGHRVLAELAAARGGEGRTDVERHLAEAERSAQVRGSQHDQAKTRLLRAEVTAKLGGRAAVREAAAEALAAFEAMNMPFYAQRAAALLR
jgi:hypothetical protein